MDLKKELAELAKRKCWLDDLEFIPDDYAGGNIDDAYSGGREDGEALLARKVLQELEHGQWKPR